MINTILKISLTKENLVTLSLQKENILALEKDEVLIQVKAAPINPSDLSFLFLDNDINNIKCIKSTEDSVSFKLNHTLHDKHQNKVNKILNAGYEGSGIIIDVGANISKGYIGRTISCATGSMYAKYKIEKFKNIIIMPPEISPADAASGFVNPMTALCILWTLSKDKHQAFIHTVGSSSLGKMLCKLCLERSVPLISIVRSKEQHFNLLKLGNTCVQSLESESFNTDLRNNILKYRPTACFDPIGGGNLLSQIMNTMENVYRSINKNHHHYGTDIKKHGYIYGKLNREKIIFNHEIGFSWMIEGWLLSNIVKNIPCDELNKMKTMIQKNILTTFKTDYFREINLSDLTNIDIIKKFGTLRSGHKYLVKVN